MHKEILKGKILTSMGTIPELHELQKQVDDRYRVTPKQFWQTVEDVCLEQSKKVKTFVDNYEHPEFVFVPAVKIAMDHLSKVLLYAEKMLIVFNRDRVVN